MGKKPSEDEFVNEALSEEETAVLEAKAAEPPVEEDAGPEQEQEQPQPEPKAKKRDDDEPKTVDIRALQEARAENRDIREKYARLEERTNLILQQLNRQPQAEQPQKEADPEPNPDEDIIAHHAWLARQFKAMKDASSQQQQEQTRIRQETQQAQQMEQAIWDTWTFDTDRYSKENPDFPNAAKWLADTRNQQLAAIGSIDQRLSTQRARDAQINAELKQIIVTAAQQGRSPAEVVYQFAQSYGYKPAEGGQEQRNGADTVQDLANRQERHRSLSDAQGGEAPKRLDAKALASMSDAQFKKLMSDPSKAAEIDRIMGIA